MIIRVANENELADRPSTDEAPTGSTFTAQATPSALSPDRNWLYRSPGIPAEGKGRSSGEQNPWTSAPAQPVETPVVPKSQPVAAPTPPPMPPPVPVLTPSVFLNPAPAVAHDLYGHTPPAPPHDDPFVAATKAVVSTVVICLGFWFAASLYVASIMMFFPFAFNAWEGDAIALSGLGISGLIAFLMALWIGAQARWWWGVLAFVFWPIVFAVYVYKQNRGMVSRSGRPVAKFPTMVTIGSMIGLGVFVLIASFFFLLHNYSDEISRGKPPFDRYSYSAQPPGQQRPESTSF